MFIHDTGRANDYSKRAPFTENQDAIDEDMLMNNNSAEPYDIRQDLDYLPLQIMSENCWSIIFIPDEDYWRQIKILNRKQSV